MKDAAYTTDDDLGFSFENYLLSHYEELWADVTLSCVVCKKLVSSSYSHRGKGIDCHKECLAFLLFYQFMHQYNVDTVEGSEEASVTPSLMKLYGMPYEATKLENHIYACCLCGTKTAYFKCASEKCENYYHIQCNASRVVVARHAAPSPDGNQPSYRFAFCHLHMNANEIDLVKRRFHSKVVRIAEYEIFQKAMGESQKESSAGNSSSSTANGNVTNTNNRAQSNTKHLKNERTGISTRSASIQKKSDDSMMPMNDLKVDKRAVRAEQNNAKNAHIKDYIACLVNEYGVLRRQSCQKNIKKFEWWPYDVIFSKVGPDLFGTTNPINSTLVELYKDLRAVLCFEKPTYSMDDLKKITQECEPCVINISNSVTSQLQRLSIMPNTGTYSFDPINGIIGSVGPDVFRQDSTYADAIATHYMMNDANIGTNLADDMFEIMAYRTSRPCFALARLGGAAAWFSCIYLRSMKHNVHKVVLADYVSMGAVEYEYLRRVLRSVYHLRKQGKVVPILSRPSYVQKVETQQGAKTVALGGFTWDVNPTSNSYLRNADVSASNSPSYMNAANPDTRIEDEVQVDDLDRSLSPKDGDIPEKQLFVVKQAKTLLNVLRTLNGLIDKHTRRLQEKVDLEHLYSKRMHENKALVEQYSQTASRMNRWSHFRWSMHQAVEQFNYLLTYEGEIDHDEEKIDAIKDTTDKEFCSVCLMSEQAYKQLLHQCSRCFIRVHYKCYVSYKTKVNESSNSFVKAEDTSSKWYCDPCEYEICMNSHSRGATCNNAVCCICCSSGGALKRTGDGTNKKNSSHVQVRWIHLHCAAFIMPKITCLDWMDLNKWDIKGLKVNNSDKCNICRTFGGYMLQCCEDGCTSKFHVTCAWVSGAYVGESCTHNTSEIRNAPKFAYSELYPTLSFEMACMKHTVQRFSERAVKTLQKRMSIAYTHYLYNPQSSLKETKESKALSLPLQTCLSPVTITKTGPIKTQVYGRESPSTSREPTYNPPDQHQYDVQMRQMKMPMMQTAPEMVHAIPQQMMMKPQYQSMVMMNTPHGIMMNGGHGMVVSGGHPVFMNGAHAMMPNRPPAMVMNGRPHIMVNGNQHLMMAAHHPRMMMMNPPVSMPPSEVQKPMAYGIKRPYMNEQPRYGVSAIASHLSSSVYAQPMPDHGMHQMEAPVPCMMTPYGAPVTTVPMNGALNHMVPHPQYIPSGYMQPVQMVPKYWNPRTNQMQYNETHPVTENPYLGVEGMGYMEH